MRRDGNVIADVVGVVFEVAVEIGDEMAVTAEMRDGRSGASRQDADVMRDVGVGPDRVDEYWLNYIFAGVTINVEGELVIGAAPLAEVYWVAGRDFKHENLGFVGSGIVIGFGGRRGLRRWRFRFGGGDLGLRGNERRVAE